MPPLAEAAGGGGLGLVLIIAGLLIAAVASLYVLFPDFFRQLAMDTRSETPTN